LQARTYLATAIWLTVSAAAALALSFFVPVARLQALAAGATVALCLGAGVMLWLSRRRTQSALDTLSAVAPIFDAATGPRIITHASGKVLYANAFGREWLEGRTPLELLEQQIDTLTEGATDHLDRLSHAVETGLAAAADIPLLGAGDDPDWFAVSVRPLAVGDGLLLWSAEDITARKTIDDILISERQDLSDFLFYMPAGIYSVDVDGSFRFVNQRFAEWLGYEQETLAALHIDDIMAGNVRPQPDGEWQGEVQFKTRSGGTLPALVLQSTYDDAGVTRTRTLVVRDGVRRESGGASGRFATERFRALFDAAPVAIAITDPDGVIVDCNVAFERLSHQTRAGLIGLPLADCLALDDRRVFDAELNKVLDGESEGAHMDLRVISPAESAQASVFVGPLTAGGGDIEGAVAHFIDVTEQKNLEVQFAQAQKMQAMGQLAGGVAHDFNNLLTAMIGFCDLLLQRHAAGDPSFADIMQIKQNANRAANLVRQLLAFSRKQPLVPRELNVTDALSELSHLLTRLIGESIDFKLIHGRELGLVRVDPGQFDQIIINLAVNARDAMTGGGTLTITTGTDTFDVPTQLGAEQVPPGRFVRIEVADSGKGIAPENLARIFEPFFSTKKEVPGAGTGLGLATVYGIVRQTGGFILVDSAPGKGAKFTIYLPRFAQTEDGETAQAKRTPVRPPMAENDTSDHGGEGTILLVEDEDAVRVFAARALKNKGYKVLEARTGEQALDILRDQPAVDLMVTDMMMPGMDGGTLARLIRVERPEIKIILISGYSEEVARGDVVNTPDFHFLPKPFSLGQLAGKVKDVLAE